MEEFITNVTTAVVLNAETIKEQYISTGIDIDKALTDPWDSAIAAMSGYEINGLEQMNAWLSGNGYFGVFKSSATDALVSPWGVGTSALNAFRDSVAVAMANVANAVRSNVQNAISNLSSLYSQIADTEAAASYTWTDTITTQSSMEHKKTYTDPSQTVKVSSSSTFKDTDGTVYYRITDGAYTGYYVSSGSILTRKGNDVVSGYKDSGTTIIPEGTKLYKKKYAKGTTGTKKDEWSLDSEPQFGDELVLVPNKGILSYMRKGTSVIPADLTKNLMEWGQMNPNTMNMGSSIIQPVVANTSNNTNAINLNFDSFIKAENITDATMDDLSKMVDQKIDKFNRDLNYAIRKIR